MRGTDLHLTLINVCESHWRDLIFKTSGGKFHLNRPLWWELGLGGRFPQEVTNRWGVSDQIKLTRLWRASDYSNVPEYSGMSRFHFRSHQHLSPLREG